MTSRPMLVILFLFLILMIVPLANGDAILESRITGFQQSWGELGFDISVHSTQVKGSPLQIKDKKYTTGLGTNAKSSIAVNLNGLYERFDAEVGVQWQGGKSGGSVVFQVFVDGQKKFDSGIMRDGDPAKAVSVDTAGAADMLLVVDDTGDGIRADAADWADARLIPAQGVKPLVSEGLFNTGQFARVVTFDPNNQGSYPNRTQELTSEQLFLETDLADESGNYVVPVRANGIGCIGLQWNETRLIKELALEFADGSAIPDVNAAKVQWWIGESVWHGGWKTLAGPIRQQGNRWAFVINLRDVYQSQSEQATAGLGTQKVRWIFPAPDKRVIVKQPHAYSPLVWDKIKLNLVIEKPQPGKTARIGVYNGTLIEPKSNNADSMYEWDLGKSLALEVLYCKSEKSLLKTDRTLLNLQMPEGDFSISIDDILQQPGIYVRDFGLFVTTEPAKMTLEQYKQTIAGKETILQKVRKMPDQSYQQAMSKVHNKIQDNGPTMLSLACDNNKFLVQREGTISFADNAWLRGGILQHHLEKFSLTPTFGSGANKELSRHLYGSWLPIPVTTVRDGGISYSERTFSAPSSKKVPSAHPWLSRSPIFVAEFSIENLVDSTADASLKLKFMADANNPGQFKEAPGGLVVHHNGKLIAFVDTSPVTSLQIKVSNGQILLNGPLPAQMIQSLFVYIPSWELTSDQYKGLGNAEQLLADTESYWKGIVQSAAVAELPEPLLNSVIRSQQIRCLIASRNEENGKRFAPWIAAWVYGPFESEAHALIRGMDFWGYQDYAQRGLDYYINKYNPAGYLTTGYTWMGLGWHLWTLGEYYQRSQNKQWLKSVAPEIDRVSQWIVRQREKTEKTDATGKKLPEYGLIPPGVSADWNRFAYRAYNQGNFCAGLTGAAKVLGEVNNPDAKMLKEQADEFHKETARAFNWAQAHAPVVGLSDGTWVPYMPPILNCFGLCSQVYPGEDWGRTAVYDAELGGHILVPLGIINKDDRCVDWMINFFEDVMCLYSNEAGDLPTEENQLEWYDRGGFAKYQPYYARLIDIYAMRDEVKPFIRSYFNPSTGLLNTENLTFWECFHNMGAWDKTHETGWYLSQSRIMLVMERGDELWLAPFVTTHWMKPSMVVALSNAPTNFGPVSYRITSHADKGYIEATIEPPTRQKPKAIVIRLRHPEEKKMKSVTVNGKTHSDFNPEKEYVRIENCQGTTVVRAEF